MYISRMSQPLSGISTATITRYALTTKPAAAAVSQATRHGRLICRIPDARDPMTPSAKNASARVGPYPWNLEGSAGSMAPSGGATGQDLRQIATVVIGALEKC
jgi:hypothetical protein